ncbi:MAG: polysaccharide biosynthesis/export family protein [Gemmatimonadota bacterium]
MEQQRGHTRGKMGRRRESFVLSGLLSLVWVAAPAPAAAQMYGPRMASREQLETSLDSLQEVLDATRDRDRADALQREILGIRYRLEHGDIWAGDILALTVAGEANWTGSFTVSPRRELELPDIEAIRVQGVLYSELGETIAATLSRYLREPRITVDVLKRIAVLGAVGTPGFFNVKGSALVSDALMLAGGPASNAKVRGVKIRRAGERVSPGRPQVAFESLSLDQLGVVSGDELFVPTKGGPPTRILLGLLGVAGTVTLIITRAN